MKYSLLISLLFISISANAESTLESRCQGISSLYEKAAIQRDEGFNEVESYKKILPLAKGYYKNTSENVAFLVKTVYINVKSTPPQEIKKSYYEFCLEQ